MTSLLGESPAGSCSEHRSQEAHFRAARSRVTMKSLRVSSSPYDEIDGRTLMRDVSIVSVTAPQRTIHADTDALG